MMLCLLALVGTAFAQGGFSDTLTFTGDVEADFTVNGAPRRGVVKIEDANFG